MNDNHETEVGSVFCEVVEQQACMFCMVAEADEIPEEIGDCYLASIRFSGVEEGTLTMLAPRAAALELAANVLGLEEDSEQVAEDAEDALGELMNVTVGQLLTVTFAGEPFDLSPPRVDKSVAPADWKSFAADEGTLSFLLEDHPVLLRFEVDAVKPV